MAEAPPGFAASPSSEPKPSGPAPSRRSILLRILLLVAVIGFVFVVVLPRVVDYEAVGAALAELTPTQLVALIGASVVGYIANAGPSRLLVPGLTWPRAVGADIAGRAVVSTIPGPTDIAVKFVLYRQWGIPSEAATAGTALAGFFEQVSSLVLPLIATFGVVVAGRELQPDVNRLTAIGLVAFVIAAAVLMAMNRSESVARRVGEALDWLARHLWPLVGKTPPSGIVERTLEVRERSAAILSRAGMPAFGAAVAAKLAWFLVLEVCLWAVGVSSDVLPPSAVLAAMAVVGIVALVPITPGGVGVSEVAYVGLLSSAAEPGVTPAITAAVMLFRIAQWLAPIPIGWVVLAFLRRSQLKDLLRGVTTGDSPA
jgi:putative heme transporter